LEKHFLQHHFNNVFYNIASTSLLQHRLLQHCFNTAFATSSSAATLQTVFITPFFATLLQHRLCNIVFYNTNSTPLLLLSGDEV
jgi:hypothetical protein